MLGGRCGWSSAQDSGLPAGRSGQEIRVQAARGCFSSSGWRPGAGMLPVSSSHQGSSSNGPPFPPALHFSAGLDLMAVCQGSSPARLWQPSSQPGFFCRIRHGCPELGIPEGVPLPESPGRASSRRLRSVCKDSRTRACTGGMGTRRWGGLRRGTGCVSVFGEAWFL